MDNEVLAILQENQRLLKKQEKQNLIRNIILAIMAAMVVITSAFIMAEVNQAMTAVAQVEQTAADISADLQEIDFESLGNSIENLESITDGMTTTIDSFNAAVEGMKNIFSFGGRNV